MNITLNSFPCGDSCNSNPPNIIVIFDTLGENMTFNILNPDREITFKKKELINIIEIMKKISEGL